MKVRGEGKVSDSAGLRAKEWEEWECNTFGGAMNREISPANGVGDWWWEEEKEDGVADGGIWYIYIYMERERENERLREREECGE